LFIWQIVLITTIIYSIKTISATAITAQTTTSSVGDKGLYAVGAGLAIGLSTIGAGSAIKTTGTAAISMLAERPEQYMKAFLVVALGEALAIYGLIVGILLWTKI